MENALKKTLNVLISASLLGGALAFTGCSEAPKPESAAPVATPAPVASAPVEAKPAGDLGKAKEGLEKAVTELKAKNYAAALSSVDAAGKELTAVATNSSLPAPIKETIAKASTNLEPIKALIEKKDASAEKSLMASIASLGKLSEMTKLMGGGMTDAAKGAAAGAAGALGGMMKSAADKTTAAGGAAAEKAGEMMPKKN
jgi:hypothetical protein